MSEDHDSGADSQRQPTNADLLEAVTGLRGAVDAEFTKTHTERKKQSKHRKSVDGQLDKLRSIGEELAANFKTGTSTQLWIAKVVDRECLDDNGALVRIMSPQEIYDVACTRSC